jgi:hypothetical protein
MVSKEKEYHEWGSKGSKDLKELNRGLSPARIFPPHDSTRDAAHIRPG